ncbi:MAG: hypothetical protein RIR00_236 [Pseudomonadota bacterium]|jgi:hypothetical protein
MKSAGLGAAMLVVLLATSTSAGAQTRIQGNTRIDATSQNVTTVASGTGNTARTTIGGVRDGKIQGNTNIAVGVKNVSNVVGGRNQKGCINIGVRSNGPDCQ